MGEDPRVRGLFHGVGFNSAGMMLVLGGGCGDQRSHESYVKNYAMVFPHDPWPAGT